MLVTHGTLRPQPGSFQVLAVLTVLSLGSQRRTLVRSRAFPRSGFVLQALPRFNTSITVSTGRPLKCSLPGLQRCLRPRQPHNSSSSTAADAVCAAGMHCAARSHHPPQWFTAAAAQPHAVVLCCAGSPLQCPAVASGLSAKRAQFRCQHTGRPCCGSC